MGNELTANRSLTRQKGDRKMKKFQIWETTENIGEEGGMLIPATEITSSILLDNVRCYIINGMAMDSAVIDALNEKDALAVIEDEEDVSNFLTAYGIHFDALEVAGDIETARDVVVYDTYNREFSNLTDFNATPTYQWWDGSNWKTVHCYDGMTVTEVVTEDGFTQNLDEWDGSDWNTGGQKFYHEHVYRVIELDGKPVEDTFLLWESSQWQGSHDTARILTKDELTAHIEALNNPLGKS